MTDSEQNELIRALIGRKLGLADEEDETRLGKAGQECERILARLDKALAPLDAWSVPDPPEDLNRRILRRIESINRTISFEEAAALQSEAPASRRGGWYISIRDLVAAAACITLLVGLFVPGYRSARSIHERNLCQANMNTLYAGMASFAGEHEGGLPYAGPQTDACWLPARSAGAHPGSNTRHMYVLLRMRYVPNPRVFVCPSRPNDVPMNVQACAQLEDFPEPSNVSYSMQNMAGPYRPKMGTEPNMAILGDANPLFDPDVITSLLGQDVSHMNSKSHGKGKGQNVLYLSGRVNFARNPNVGVAGDNIWQAGQLTRYTGTEVPQYATDSFLIP